MNISIIVAVSNGWVIGNKKSLPWYLPADLKHFKEITMGHYIIMGQNTHESIGKPLPGRFNIILSLDPKYKSKGCVIAHSLKEALNFAKNAGEKEVFVIGGASVYKQAISIANIIYLTKIHHNFKGDVFFPEIDFSKWKQISCEKHDYNEKNPYAYEFLVYEKIS
jgi:dihydrofolate reductase